MPMRNEMRMASLAPRAVFLLGILCVAGPAYGADMAQKVREMLETKDIQRMCAISNELSDIVGPKDLPTLARCLNEAKKGQNVTILLHLMNTAGEEKAVPYFRAALAHKVFEVKGGAALQLAGIGEMSWAKEFLKAIADPTNDVTDRKFLVMPFSHPLVLGQQNSEVLGYLIDVAGKMLKADPPDPGADGLTELIIQICGRAKRGRFTQFFRDAMEAGGPLTKSAAAAALVQLGDPAGLDWILNAYKTGAKSDNDLLRNLWCLWGIRGKKMNDLLSLVLKQSANPQLILLAIRLLGESRDPSVIDLLKERIADKNEEIAGAALKALGCCGEQSLIPFWKEQLGSKDALVRVRAASQLLASDQPESLPILLEVVKDRTADANVRMEAVLALAMKASLELVEPLMAGLEDPEEKVRKSCWVVLEKVFRAFFPYRGPTAFDSDANASNPRSGGSRIDPKSIKDVTPDMIKSLRDFWNARK